VIFSLVASGPYLAKGGGFVFAASFEGAVIEQQINPFPFWSSTFWSVFCCVQLWSVFEK
jgi:hypothetical protein